jgi:hypothetical protein
VQVFTANFIDKGVKTKMIVIRTVKIEKATNKPYYKEYYCTTGVAAGMQELKQDKHNNDLAIYTPIEIVSVFDTNEE